MKGYVIRCAVVAALCGLLPRFDTAVISSTTNAQWLMFQPSDAAIVFTVVAVAQTGTIIASLSAACRATSSGE